LAALTQVTRWQPQIIDQSIDLDDLRFSSCLVADGERDDWGERGWWIYAR